jgi:hypothetical protein
MRLGHRWHDWGRAIRSQCLSCGTLMEYTDMEGRTVRIYNRNGFHQTVWSRERPECLSQ